MRSIHLGYVEKGPDGDLNLTRKAANKRKTGEIQFVKVIFQISKMNSHVVRLMF